MLDDLRERKGGEPAATLAVSAVWFQSVTTSARAADGSKSSMQSATMMLRCLNHMDNLLDCAERQVLGGAHDGSGMAAMP